MEPNNIQNADILDIIFEGRNKDYGAYELRKTYNRRVRKSLFAMGSLVGLLFIGGWVAGRNHAMIRVPVIPVDPTIVVIDPLVKPLPPVPQIKIPAAPVAMIRFVTTRVVPDKEVPKDEKPPENDDLDKVKIGTVNTPGSEDVGLDVPVGDKTGSGLVTGPKKADDDNDGRPWTKVEIDASFPGGQQAWARFLNKNLRAPDDAVNNNISGQVVVQFVVDKDGNVSDVEAISGPEQGGLREEAIRVIRKSGKWTPALQNGRYVKAYRKQPVIFQIGE